MDDDAASLRAALDGQVEYYQPSFFVPTYPSARFGRWEIRHSKLICAQGYWSPAKFQADVAALMRDSDTWMSITAMELESQEIGISAAYGHVVIFGLGMGWSAAATAIRAQVTAVTVVELDPDVIALHADIDIFAQLPAKARSKIRIDQGDAFEWRSNKAVDVLMPDIWLPLISDGRVAEVQRMHRNTGASAVYFWGQEMEIARHAKAAGNQLDDQGIAATVTDFGLPLIGPETPAYPQRVAAVAERWMHGRWLSASAR
jgi:hypothetical protein